MNEMLISTGTPVRIATQCEVYEIPVYELTDAGPVKLATALRCRFCDPEYFEMLNPTAYALILEGDDK